MAQPVSACPYGLCAAQDKGINGVPAVICTAGTTRFGAMCKVASQREAEVWSVLLRLLDGIRQTLENHGQGGCLGNDRGLRRTPEVVLRVSHSRMGYGLSVLFGYAEMALILPAWLFAGVKTLASVPWKSCRKTSLMAGTVHRLRHINDTYNIIRYKATRHRV